MFALMFCSPDGQDQKVDSSMKSTDAFKLVSTKNSLALWNWSVWPVWTGRTAWGRQGSSYERSSLNVLSAEQIWTKNIVAQQYFAPNEKCTKRWRCAFKLSNETQIVIYCLPLDELKRSSEMNSVLFVSSWSST